MPQISMKLNTGAILHFQGRSNAAMPMNMPNSAPTTSEHDRLTNRDLPGQHPISAIDGLEEALNNKLGITDVGYYSEEEVLVMLSNAGLVIS